MNLIFGILYVSWTVAETVEANCSTALARRGKTLVIFASLCNTNLIESVATHVATQYTDLREWFFNSHFPCCIVLRRGRDEGRYEPSSVERKESVIDFYSIPVSFANYFHFNSHEIFESNSCSVSWKFTHFINS